MATTAGTAATTVRRRVYGYTGIAHTEDDVISVISYCQQVINAFTRSVVASETQTVAANTPDYFFTTYFPYTIDILKVVEDVAGVLFELGRVGTPGELAAYEPGWFANATGTRYLAWCQVGRDQLFIYPTKAASGSVSVFYTKITDALTLAADEFDVPDEEVTYVTDLAEIVLLAKDKQITVCQDKIAQLAEHLNLELRRDES